MVTSGMREAGYVYVNIDEGVKKRHRNKLKGRKNHTSQKVSSWPLRHIEAEHLKLAKNP